MADKFPHYDVLSKRLTPSWNDKTRDVINARLAVSREPRFLSPGLFKILDAVCERLVPQPKSRPPIPVAAYVDQKLLNNKLDGYRFADMPEQGEAYRLGLSGFEEAAQQRHHQPFVRLDGSQRDTILRDAQMGRLRGGAWGDMSSEQFFIHRLLLDVTSSYWAHPTAWSEMGFGGPAGPRGYVRMGLNRRDPWEAVEVKSGEEE